MFLIDRKNVPAKEVILVAGTFIEGIIVSAVRSPVRIIRRVKPNADRSRADVEQVVLVVKVPANSQINETQKDRQTVP